MYPKSYVRRDLSSLATSFPRERRANLTRECTPSHAVPSTPRTPWRVLATLPSAHSQSGLSAASGIHGCQQWVSPAPLKERSDTCHLFIVTHAVRKYVNTIFCAQADPSVGPVTSLVLLAYAMRLLTSGWALLEQRWASVQTSTTTTTTATSPDGMDSSGVWSKLNEEEVMGWAPPQPPLDALAVQWRLLKEEVLSRRDAVLASVSPKHRRRLQFVLEGGETRKYVRYPELLLLCFAYDATLRALVHDTQAALRAATSALCPTSPPCTRAEQATEEDGDEDECLARSRALLRVLQQHVILTDEEMGTLRTPRGSWCADRVGTSVSRRAEGDLHLVHVPILPDVFQRAGRDSQAHVEHFMELLTNHARAQASAHSSA